YQNADCSPDRDAHENVAQVMQPEDHTRGRNAQSTEDKTHEQARVVEPQSNGNGEGGDRVARRKGEPVRRQQHRPAMRLDRAGPLASDEPLQHEERDLTDPDRDETALQSRNSL